MDNVNCPCLYPENFEKDSVKSLMAQKPLWLLTFILTYRLFVK